MRMILSSLLVVAVVGCGSKKEKETEPPPAPAPTPAPTVTEPKAPTPPAPTPAPPAATSTARPNHTLFPELEGKAPVFPQLKADGKIAIASVVKGVGPSGKTKSWLDVIGPDGKPGKPIDADKKSAASEVQAMLAAGKFTPFEARVDLESATGPIKHGDVVLDIKDTDKGISLVLSDAKGTKLQERAIDISDTCSANPRPDYAWFDSARKRVLVEVGWELGPHDCNDSPAPLFVFWPLP